MVTILSVFLGLVTGVQPVELAVSGPVAAVELRLDGHGVGTLRGAPWTLACDFGPGLAPHQLVAIGRDADGREIARAEQWINLPRPRSEIELVLEDAAEGRPTLARPVGTRTPDATQPLELFHISIDFGTLRPGPRSMGVGRKRIADPTPEGLLAAIPYAPTGPLEDVPQRLADAVAVAGTAASAGRRARAVVLLTGADTPDLSVHTAAEVRGYLRRLQVPFVVWAAGAPKDWDTWGASAVELDNRNQLYGAIRGLRSLLDRQAVVWLEGRHLPHEIELSPAGLERLGYVGDLVADAPEAEPEVPEIERWVAEIVPADETVPIGEPVSEVPETVFGETWRRDVFPVDCRLFVQARTRAVPLSPDPARKP